MPRSILASLPRGRLLPDEVWRRRHRFIVILAWLHPPAIVLFGVATGTPLDALAMALLVAFPALVASIGEAGRAVRSAMASLALLLASAILVHLSGGRIELHFHFFVAVALLALYQEWLTFLLAIGFVVAHHFVLGTVLPMSVFDHSDGQADPLLWSLVHGTYVGALSAVSVVAWSMSQRAFRDELTGLASRSLFVHRLEDALARYRPDRGPAPTLLFLDLDDFKTVNDSLGHGAGDELLAGVASRLLDAVGPDGTPGRLGGDEFGVLAATGSLREATLLAERILHGMAAPYEIRGEAVSVAASIGVVRAGADVLGAVEMLRDADLAMYSAKAAGKERLAVFEPAMHDAARRRLRLKEGLRHAVENGEMHLDYQPIVSLATGAVTCVEALARWRHADLGPIAPAEFIPLAEESGMIVDIGRWVLETACRQAVALGDTVGRPTMSVNLSVRQLRDPNLVGDLATCLAATGLAPERLLLEITESVVMDDVETSLRALAALRALGVRLAIDDFGTGYSSLSYLRQLPVDTVKIDRSFVAELDEGTVGHTLAGAVVSVCRMFGLRTTAEGVEEPGQVAALRAVGCDEAQGYLFARPVGAEKLGVLLECLAADRGATRDGQRAVPTQAA